MNTCVICKFAAMGLLCLSVNAFGQQSDRARTFPKVIQFSSFPGISTAGFETARYTYNFSFNLFSGMTAGTRYFAFATISNLGTRSSSGIQLAGMANIIGSHSYLHLTNFEEKQLENSGKTPSQTGIQLAGLLNLVRGESNGIQLAGLSNSVYKNTSGLQLGGVINFSGQNLIGLQASVLINAAGGLVMGGQVAALNLGGRRLSGFQIGGINHTKYVEGKADNTSSQSFGLQIGLVNYAGTNNGIQIGLINHAQGMRGVQIGLINFLKPGPYSGGNTVNGTPIGLLNYKSKDSRIRISQSELFPMIVEFTTGNCQNCTFTKSQMPFGDMFYKTNQNALIFGYQFSDRQDVKWAIGYGFHRMYYYKSSMSAGDPKNKKYYFSPSIRLLHLSREKELQKSLSLQTQMQFDLGMKMKTLGIYAGVSINSYFYSSGGPIDVAGEITRGKKAFNYQVWPGYIFGIQL